MIRIALCDDIQMQLDLLLDVLEDYRVSRNVEFEVTSFLQGSELLDKAQIGEVYDLYILDMIMPGMNGIEIARQLRGKAVESKIIFLTATMDYVLESFDVEAAHYLLKPINVNKLFEVLDKIFAETQKPETDTIVVKTVQGPRNLQISAIKNIEKRDRALCYSMVDGEEIEGVSLRESFAAAIDLFLRQYAFELSSVTTATNLSQVESMKGEELYMKDGTVQFCSRSKTATFRRSLNEYWKMQ